MIKESRQTSCGEFARINGKLFLFATEEDYVEYIRDIIESEESNEEEEEE